MSAPRGSLLEFLDDIEPFFYRRSLLYVDVGAYKGEVFKKLVASRLKIREAHLVEPNPHSVEVLRRNIEGLFKGHILTVHPLAAGATKGMVRLRLAESMSKVVSSSDSDATGEERPDAGTAAVECCTLDELSLQFSERHISLLKLDVEGYEDQVLSGASALLSGQEVDVIYLEAGMNPAGTQQCYFRKLDDILLGHGYRLFRIYEQKHEWQEDSPFLRRVNLAYFSPRFAEQNPCLLARELFDTQMQLQAAQAQLQSVQAQHDELAKRAGAFADGEAAHAKALAAEQQRYRALETERSELRERAQTLRRERTELARHVTELEGSVHVTTLARNELQQRLTIMTESHQTQIVRLAEGRQAQRDLEHQLAQCAEELVLTKRRLQDTEKALSALTVEKDELGSNLETLTQMNTALEQQVRQATEACDQLQALCQRERETREQCLKERETRQRKQEKQQKEQDLERQQEKKEVSQKLKTLAQELDASEAMAREVFRLYDSLSRSESRARSQALRWRTQEERTRGHLSYRVGSALVANSQSPLKWAKIPVAVARAYSGFRRERKGRHNEPTPEIEEVLGTSPNAFLSLRQQWSELRIQAAGVQEVWARALSVRPEALIDIEVAMMPNQPSSEPAGAQGEESRGGRFDDGTPQAFELHAGVPLRILRLVAASSDMTLRVRKVKGVPTILHLELRQADGAQYLARDGAASSSTTRSGNASHAVARQPSSKGAPLDVVGEHTEQAPVRKRGSIAHAQGMIRGGDFDGAIEYALANASDVERPTIELLYANHFLADERAWLRHLNAYVRQFRVAPMELAPVGPSRYLRLQAGRSRRIDAGPVVSVIMPAFNAARTLEFAARSVLNQTWRPLELIIVDDASDDATSSIAGDLAREDSRVRLFRNATNVGPYVSKNLGLLIAGGMYVTGHDADDWAHPERIENHVEAMLRGGAKASLIKMLRLTDEGEFRRIGKNTPNIDDGVLQTAFISCMLETQLLRESLGHWDSVRFGADSELIFRAQRVLGGDLPVYRQLGLLCLDSLEGLTADPVHGVSRAGGLSPTRALYRETFLKWHETLTAQQAYLPFPHHPRRFAAPEVALVPADVIIDLKARVLDGREAPSVTSWPEVASGGERRVDVCIVTNLAYPGGNASSTLDEVKECLRAGLSVKLLHCPVAHGGDMDFSARFNDYLYLCEDCRSHYASYCCDVLIVRHPGVICTPLFSDVAQSIRAQSTVVVINNSMFRAGGTRVYSEEELYERISTMPGGNTTVYPLGPAIRRELLGSSLAGKVNIAPFDWSPTFSADALRWRGARPMGRPTVIGRHGRDGQEKWLEDPEQLAAVYPLSEDVTVKILGGAERAARILGTTPRHWRVYPFGSLAPSEFLNGLDAFVYFPNSGLNEAFGRAIMEAVFVGVPCVLPTRFHETFGQLAFCCEPGEAIPAVRRLRQSYPWCAAFVERARDLAVPQYGSQVVLWRLCNASEAIARRIGASAPKRVTVPDLDNLLAAYARWVCTGEGASEAYTDGTTPGVTSTASAGGSHESETGEQRPA